MNINLNEYSGAVQLRFSLVIDQHVAAKGWVIDEIKVISGSPPLTSTHTDLQISITGPSNHQAFDGQKLFYTLTATNTEAVAVDALVIYTWPQTFGTLAGCFPACTGSGPLTWSISGFTSTQVMTVALQTYPTSALSFQTQATITHTILNITDTNPTNNYAEHQIDILQPMSPTMSIYLPILAK